MVTSTSDVMSAGILAVVCLALSALTGTGGTNITFHTQKQVGASNADYNFVPLGKFGFRADQVSSVTFQVQACSDAHIALMANVGDDSTAYIIMIGGWSNTKHGMVYRNQTQLQRKISREATSPLNCNAYNMFQVSWHNGDIEARAETDGSWQTIVDGWTIPQTFQVRDVGFSTGRWRSGFWKLDVPAYKARTKSAWITMSRFLGVRMTKGVLWKKGADNQGVCGRHCHRDQNCWSFTFDVTEKTCRGHNDMYKTKEDGEGETTPSSFYFVMVGE